MLRAITWGQPDAWLDSRHGPDVFSPREAVAHLLLCERQSWVTRIRTVLEGRELKPISDSTEVTAEELAAQKTLQELLDEFETRRFDCIQELRSLNLTAADLEKAGNQSRFGPFKLENLINAWVAHDLYHLGQIFKSYAAPYTDSVGIWQNYLNLPHFN